jgi:phosphoenolpyruvate carboxylase
VWLVRKGGTLLDIWPDMTGVRHFRPGVAAGILGHSGSTSRAHSYNGCHLSPPSLEVRPEDLPLHEDVRWLAASLGRAIQRLEGQEEFETVEDLRRACRARRHGEPGAPDLQQLLQRVEQLPLERATTTARAFTLFFLLINTAEQVHRVRRTRSYRTSAATEPQPGSAAAAMRALRKAGHDAGRIEAAIRRVDARAVLTAHPTESTRRTLLGLQARVADLLLERDDIQERDRAALNEQLDAEVELLWITSEVRHDRPSVRDEVSTVIWYLETRLLDAASRARAALIRAFEDEFSAISQPQDIVPLTLGNWVGGDRDGNPFVTPEITLATARRSSYAILGRYAEALDSLIERLSISASIAPPSDELLESIAGDAALLPDVHEANRKRNADEPVRMKLTLMQARIEATRVATAARDAGRSVDELAAYQNAQEFEADLRLVRATLVSARAAIAAQATLDPLMSWVRAHGFHGYRMDVRDHADVHRAAVASISQRLGVPDLAGEALRSELAGRRPLVNEHLPLDEDTSRVLDTMRAIRTIQDEMGEEAASTYIVSMTTEPDDLLRVLLLAREAGLVDLAADPPISRIDTVPLFETLDDLENAPDIMRAMFSDPVYRIQLKARGDRQEVMIGYSDSSKDAGILASSWALYQGQAKLARVCSEAGITLRLFHGRGGSVGRGGGSPVARALAALPPGTVNGRIKITEQGEIVSQQFGLLPVAERTFEVTLAGVLLQEFNEQPASVSENEMNEFRAVMTRIAGRGLTVFREMVHEQDELFRLFRQVTPVEELANARFGSRPAFRPGAGEGIAGIRAIPWGFGWTQIRLMLPGWFGVGTALDELVSTEDGLEVLQRMAGSWPFFDDLLGKIEMVCAKADMEIASLYVRSLGGDEELFARIVREFDRTVDAILRIRESRTLLSDNGVLRSAIVLRNPYVDPLSLIQVALLRRRRNGDGSESLGGALATTLSGIAQGLRNTG